VTVPFLACMSLVASIYNLPPRVLPSIQATEGGVAGLAVRNGNGIEDLGVMQIIMRKVDGWQTLGEKLADPMPVDLAA